MVMVCIENRQLKFQEKKKRFHDFGQVGQKYDIICDKKGK